MYQFVTNDKKISWTRKALTKLHFDMMIGNILIFSFDCVSRWWTCRKNLKILTRKSLSVACNLPGTITASWWLFFYLNVKDFYAARQSVLREYEKREKGDIYLCTWDLRDSHSCRAKSLRRKDRKTQVWRYRERCHACQQGSCSQFHRLDHLQAVAKVMLNVQSSGRIAKF